MNAARTRAGVIARGLQRSVRNYASESHGPTTPVNESFGTGTILTVGAFFGGVLLYQFAPADSESSAITRTINKYLSRAEDWENINALHTKVMEQAGYDRNLFENASNKHRFVDVAYPEALQSHAKRNISAGQLVNLDHVTEHFKELSAKEEDRKLKKLAASKE